MDGLLSLREHLFDSPAAQRQTLESGVRVRLGSMHTIKPLRSKSVNEIEGISISPPYPTGMIERIAEARRVPLSQLTAENLRLLVSQKVALAYTAPVALDLLEAKPLSSGDLYIGDLLMGVLQADEEYALALDHRRRLKVVTERALDELAKVEPTKWDSYEIPERGAPDETDREHLEPRLKAALAHLNNAPAL